MVETGYPDFLLQQLDDATPKDVPMVPIVHIRAENPLAMPNLLTHMKDRVEIDIPKQFETETQMDDHDVANTSIINQPREPGLPRHS